MKRFFVTVVFAIIGGVAGFTLPLALLLALAAGLFWWHGDPAAGGVLSFLMIPLGPIGVATGILLAVARVNRWYSDRAGESKPASTLDLGRRKFLENVLGSERHNE